MSLTLGQRWQRAQAYLAQAQMAPARAQWDALRATAPAHVCTHLLAAEIAWWENRVLDAAGFVLDAARAGTDDPELTCDVVAALLRSGEVVAARRCVEQPTWAYAPSAASLVRLADFRLGLGDHAESLTLLDRALAMGDGDATLHFSTAAGC